MKIEAAALVAFACCVFHCDQIHLRLEPSPNTLSLSAPATQSPVAPGIHNHVIDDYPELSCVYIYTYTKNDIYL